jgi:glycosyltransferase involved in cell wall biosynthesis
MRLLLGCERLDLVGGSERYAADVASGLEARGHEVHVVTSRLGQEVVTGVTELPGLFDHEASPSALSAFELELRNWNPDRILLLSRAAPAVLRASSERAPTARFVQDHTLFCPGLNKLHADGSACSDPMGGACLKRFFLTKGCSGYHRDGWRPALRWPIGKLKTHQRDLAAHQELDRLLVASDYMRRELIRAGCDPSRVERVGYFTRQGEEETPKSALPEELVAFLANSDSPVILCSARLVHPDKGVDHLLTALTELENPWRCVIAGEGPARAWLEEKARDEGLSERVHFTGWLDAPVLEELRTKVSLVAVPSIWDEPFGLVGLEAMAHSLPVVAFDVGGISEWLEGGETGLLVPRRDAHAFARALDSLQSDPERAARMGAKGQRLLRERYSQAAHLCRLEDALGLKSAGGRMSAVPAC